MNRISARNSVKVIDEGTHTLMFAHDFGCDHYTWRSIVSLEDQVEIPALDHHFTENFCSTDPEISKRFAQDTFSSDRRTHLPSFHIPNLSLQGREDILTSEQVAWSLQQHRPGNQLTPLNTIGHFPQLSDPRTVTSAIRDFIYS